jgi:hypothetical protein
MSAGKGSKPRNCFSKEFRSNFDLIKKREVEGFIKAKKGKLVKKY